MGLTEGLSTVTRTYTPVPEPVPALVLGGGRVALAVRRRR